MHTHTTDTLNLMKAMNLLGGGGDTFIQKRLS